MLSAPLVKGPGESRRTGVHSLPGSTPGAYQTPRGRQKPVAGSARPGAHRLQGAVSGSAEKHTDQRAAWGRAPELAWRSRRCCLFVGILSPAWSLGRHLSGHSQQGGGEGQLWTRTTQSRFWKGFLCVPREGGLLPVSCGSFVGICLSLEPGCARPVPSTGARAWPSTQAEPPGRPFPAPHPPGVTRGCQICV